MMRRLWLVALLVAAGGWDALRAPDPDVDRGNEAFKAGRFDEALGHYRSAEARGADPRLHFDMGTALYKLGEKASDPAEKARLLQQAEEQFRRAADSDDVRLKSLAYFDLGNSMYQRQQWEDAVSAYKRALRANPKSEPARHNLEMALRQREKQDRPDQQQGQKGQKGKGQKDQKDRKQDQQGGQGQGPNDREQKDQQDQQNGQGKQDPKEGQPGQQDKDQDPEPQGGQPQGAEPPDQQQQQSRGERRSEDQKRAEREAEERRQQQQREQRERQAQPPEDGNAGTDSPTDQDRKLDELERRSRELRKRLLRQSGKNRDALHLPSRRDW